MARRRTRVARALDGKAPGDVVVLKKTRGVRKASGREFLRTEWAVKSDQEFGVNLDARTYVRALQLALADHCGESLQAQLNPKTGQPIRPRAEIRINDDLRARFGSSIDNVRPSDTLISSGTMASTWWCSQISGDRLSARGRIKPSVDGFRLKWVNYYLGAATAIDTRSGSQIAIRRKGDPIDLHSVEGLAAQVIERTVSDTAAASMGNKVRVPKRPHIGATNRRKR